jgi:hypothetical protein
MNESPLNNDGRGIISLMVLALAALLYFWLPPSYVAVGPLHLGDQTGTCHGANHDGMLLVEICK